MPTQESRSLENAAHADQTKPGHGPRCEQRSSSTHGLGLFASQRLQRGDLILSEIPLLQLPDRQSCTHTWIAYQALDTAAQADWMKLDHAPDKDQEAQLAQLAGEAEDVDICGKVLAKFENNGFDDPVSGTRLITRLASRLDHSCTPTAVWAMNDKTKRFEGEYL